ncbi:MAG: fatty acid desaturase family protein, partial [Chitinophagales bacterium]
MQVTDYLSKEEINELLQKSDWKGFVELATTWGWIAFALALPALWLNPFTVIVSLFILGGKQLGCAIIMHDTSHYAFFNSRKLNSFFGNWLGGYPIFQNVEDYRPYHFKHHRNTGTNDDPDLNLTTGYPTSKVSMLRKFSRDLAGVTGFKTFYGVLLMHFGYLKYNLGGLVEKIKAKNRNWKSMLNRAYVKLRGPVVFHLLFFTLLYAIGFWWLYLLWWGAFFTTYNFSLRVRSIAEHSVVPNQLDPQKNTRTTYANFIERILFAPHHVNYHAEHHLLMAAPSYNYPKMHEVLLKKGFYNEGLLEPNYRRIVKLAVSGS